MMLMPDRLYGFLLLTVLLISGCAGSRTVSSGRGSTTVDYNSYNEDLSSVRPVYNSVPPTPPAGNRPTVPASAPATTPRKPDIRKATAPIEALHINRKLDMVLDTLATENRSIRYAPGYRIQVYVGTQRQQVEDAKLLITQSFPELNPYLSYNQPTYKLKVGDFMRRLDAERYYSVIRRLITSAQLQPDKVDIRRSLLIK
jgi:hypothetical protein